MYQDRDTHAHAGRAPGACFALLDHIHDCSVCGCSRRLTSLRLASRAWQTCRCMAASPPWSSSARRRAPSHAPARCCTTACRCTQCLERDAATDLPQTQPICPGAPGRAGRPQDQPPRQAASRRRAARRDAPQRAQGRRRERLRTCSSSPRSATSSACWSGTAPRVRSPPRAPPALVRFHARPAPDVQVMRLPESAAPAVRRRHVCPATTPGPRSGSPVTRPGSALKFAPPWRLARPARSQVAPR